MVACQSDMYVVSHTDTKAAYLSIDGATDDVVLQTCRPHFVSACPAQHRRKECAHIWVVC